MTEINRNKKKQRCGSLTEFTSTDGEKQLTGGEK